MIEVADDGGPGGAGPSLLATSATLGVMPGSGRGLLGLRERVLLYGGELEAGRPSGGGWRVRTVLRLGPDPAPAGGEAAARADGTGTGTAAEGA